METLTGSRQAQRNSTHLFPFCVLMSTKLDWSSSTQFPHHSLSTCCATLGLLHPEVSCLCLPIAAGWQEITDLIFTDVLQGQGTLTAALGALCRYIPVLLWVSYLWVRIMGSPTAVVVSQFWVVPLLVLCYLFHPCWNLVCVLASWVKLLKSF